MAKIPFLDPKIGPKYKILCIIFAHPRHQNGKGCYSLPCSFWAFTLEILDCSLECIAQIRPRDALGL